jgi:hypothetical protein
MGEMMDVCKIVLDFIIYLAFSLALSWFIRKSIKAIRIDNDMLASTYITCSILWVIMMFQLVIK